MYKCLIIVGFLIVLLGKVHSQDDNNNTMSKIEPMCTNGVYTSSNESATIESLGGDSCWVAIITPTNPVGIIEVSFEQFDMKDGGACEHYIQLEIDCSKYKICGTNGTSLTYETKGHIILEYVTNTARLNCEPNLRPYFKLKYRLQVTGCVGWKKVLSPGKKEFITSHQKLNNTEPNKYCRWDIEVSENKVAEIKFNTFILDGTDGSCDGDVVKIWSGDEGFADTKTEPDYEICGTPKGLVAVNGKGKYMTVVFETDVLNKNTEFSAEVIERNPPACPPLNNNAVSFHNSIGYGTICQWSFENSVDLTIDNYTLKDGDSISVHRKRDMALINQLRGPKQGTNVKIQTDTGAVVIFKSSYIQDTNLFHALNFRAVYNCRNFEVVSSTEMMSRQRGRWFCFDHGLDWNLLIDDAECKHDKVTELWIKDCTPDPYDGLRGTDCPFWMGLTRNKNTKVWSWEVGIRNEKPLQESAKKWLPGEPEDNEDCMVIQRKGNSNVQQWAYVTCEPKNYGAYCSRLTQ